MKIYIFACNTETMQECFSRNLFGGGTSWLAHIAPGDFCCLHNYDEKQVYGLWQAKSGCAWHEKDAWGGKYRYQVRVQLISKALQQVPLFVLANLIEADGNFTWKLYGEKAQNLFQYFGSRYRKELNFGIKLTAIEKDFRKRYPKDFSCEDGHSVRSLSEKTIDEWLYNHGLVHAYEQIIHVPAQLVPNFTVYGHNGVVALIEFWGMIDDPIYTARINSRCQIHTDRLLPLIELRPPDLQNLDYALSSKLKQKNVAIPQA